ncbi:S-adenosylmethionine decarboxylase [Bradyrhizobium sp. NBAIM08]|uniref:S-adenosylmethionine decarboxylase n=1 Tax=Bradyrhizobium sp. NBAIM08 TaxID=2793815 RepID=UPI001CD435EA|nr:S-adenosylmethionine decarboxylase [Bradyrhizobium sp. NBAIM08]
MSDSERIATRFTGGNQLVVELWGAAKIDDWTIAEVAIPRAIDATRSTLECFRLRKSPGDGSLFAVARMADAQIVIHAWPKNSYAIIGILARGGTEACRAASVLIEAFQPERSEIRTTTALTIWRRSSLWRPSLG